MGYERERTAIQHLEAVVAMAAVVSPTFVSDPYKVEKQVSFALLPWDEIEAIRKFLEKEK